MQSHPNKTTQPPSFPPPKRHHPLRRWLIFFGTQLGFGKQAVEFVLKQNLSDPSNKQAFSQYQPTHHDVFVATFPKSGTNWLMQIAQQIAHLGAAEFKHIHNVVAWPDAPGQFPVPLNDPTPQRLSPTGLRVIKTHLEPSFIPHHQPAKYLTVLRDPKEVLVSTYYFRCGLLGVLDHISIDDWYEISQKNQNLVKAWARHTASIWNWRDRPNTLILNYREIKKNPQLAIEQVAAIMGVELTEPQLAKVLTRSSFDYMKAHESQFAPPPPPSVRQAKPTLMIRQGKSGEAGKYLSQTQLGKIDLACQAELQRLGSNFPYATAFDLECAKN